MDTQNSTISNSAGSASLDQKTLESLEDSMDIESLRKIIELFIEDTHRRLSCMQEAFDHEDWQRLQHEAHNLKSAAATFGLQSARQEARELDQACQQSIVPDKIKAHIDALRAELPEALKALAIRYQQKS